MRKGKFNGQKNSRERGDCLPRLMKKCARKNQQCSEKRCKALQAPTCAPIECEWLKGNTAEDNLLQCGDGTFCNAATHPDGWACCVDHCTRVQCPPNYPEMCDNIACGGGKDYCCSTSCIDGGNSPR